MFKNYKLLGNETGFVIVAGILGFLFAFALLGGKSCSGKVVYHEVAFPNKDSITRKIYSSQIVSLYDSIKRVSIKSADYKKLISELTTKIAGLRMDSINLSDRNIDTTDTIFGKMLWINRKVLREAIRSDSLAKYKTKSITLVYDDTNQIYNKKLQVGTVRGKLKITEPTTFVSFISDNPMAGIWLIISIAQMILWFFVPILLFERLRTMKAKVNYIPGLFTVFNWAISSIIPFVFFFIFTDIFYNRMVDMTVIHDHYFLDRFNDKMFWYAAIGYLTATVCFGMYLHMSMSLDQVNTYARKNNLTIANDPTLKENYIAIKKTFDTSFLITALILSLFVLWLGIVFIAINKTEAMRFYKITAGTDFLPSDFVYLVGAFHTIILLLFYIPVKLKFDSLELVDQAQSGQANSRNKFISNIYDGIGTLLMTASPLLASLIQKLLNGLISG